MRFRFNPLTAQFDTSAGCGCDSAVIINDFSTSTINPTATANHDYIVTALKTLSLSQIVASATGRIKVEIQVETGAGTNIFNTKFVQFNDTNLYISQGISVAAGVRVRVIITNRDSAAMDVYSTICGYEI